MKFLTFVRNLALGAAVALSVEQSVALAATNLVSNPGFESGSFAGWTQSGNLGFTSVTGGAAQSGSFGASFGPVGSLGFISQTLATTVGETYQLDYWLRNLGGVPNVFEVRWDGGLVDNLTNIGAFAYTQFSFSGLVATSASTTLSFGFQQNPSFWNFDNVNVEATGSGSGAASVPDGGATAGLMALGLVALAAVRRKLR